MMDLVMLATSARPDTRLLHATAWRRAEEEGSGLLVVHVLGGGDYERQPAKLRHAIRDEMKWLLHAMLAPTTGAAGSSIGRLTVDVREGNVVEQLIEVTKSSRPDLVLLGAPGPADADGLTADAYSRLLDFFESNSTSVEFVPPRQTQR